MSLAKLMTVMEEAQVAVVGSILIDAKCLGDVMSITPPATVTSMASNPS